MKKTHEFYIAGVQHHHQYKSILDDVKEGDNLLLTLESTNKFDPNAVRIEYATFEKQHMLGYVPRRFSSEVSALLEIGHTLECTLAEFNKNAKTWEMFKVEIFDWDTEDE